MKSYSLRVIRAIFCGNPAKTVIVAYSPTNVADENVVEDFYDTLRAAIYDTSAHSFLCILGGFNARLGPEDACFPYHESTNRNGDHLSELQKITFWLSTLASGSVSERDGPSKTVAPRQSASWIIYWLERSGETVF